MNPVDYSIRIIAELQDILAAINPRQAEQMTSEILAAKRVFVAGAGRSLLMMKAFAMRCKRQVLLDEFRQTVLPVST